MKKRTLILVISLCFAALLIISAITIPLAMNSANKKALHFVFDHGASSLASLRYDTGNYGGFKVNRRDFEYYRYNSLEGGFLALLPSNLEGAIGGSFYNVSALDNIASIDVTYSMQGQPTRNGPMLYYGARKLDESVSFDWASSPTRLTLPNLQNTRYFKLDSGDAILFVHRLEITLREENLPQDNKDYDVLGMGDGRYRAHNTSYQGSLVSGESVIDVPVEADIAGNAYTVSSSQTLTYYSYEDVLAHPNLAVTAARTSPREVAAYYSAFHEFPVNYVTSDHYEEAYAVFGSATRLYSAYHRTDGYLTSIPFANDPGASTPTYHELDISCAADYSLRNRSVLRLVALESGLKEESYQGDVVCYYSDDHYSSFQEYDNLTSVLAAVFRLDARQ